MTVEMLRPVFARAWKDWQEDQVPRLSAALTFYLMLALSPLLLFIVAATGLALQQHGGQNPIAEHLIASVRSSLGADQADFVKSIIHSSRSKGAGIAASLIGLVVALFGASGIFQQLQESVNSIWEVKTEISGIKAAIMGKLVAALMVIIGGLVLIGWLGLDAWLRIERKNLGGTGTFPVRQILSFLAAWAFWTPIFASIFRWLPNRRVAWNDVWLGAITTSFAFALTKYLLSLYFSFSSVSVSYGSAGAVVVLLLWAYYLSQLFFYGVELTRAYAFTYGSCRERDKAKAQNPMEAIPRPVL